MLQITREGRLRKGLSLAMLFTFAIVLGACDLFETEDNLSETEVVALVTGFGMLGTFGASDSVAVAECPRGGIVDVSGDITPSENTFTMDITMVPRDCAFDVAGHEFQIDGDPSVHQTGTIEIASDLSEVHVDVNIAGRIRWELKGRSGKCSLDIDVDGTTPFITEEGEDDGLTGTVAGTVCGLPVALRIEDLI